MRNVLNLDISKQLNWLIRRIESLFSRVDSTENSISGLSTALLASDHHGNFADDIAAATGSVPIGGVYYNTTTGKLHTRMT